MKYVVLGLILILLFGQWLAPSVVASAIGSANYSYTYLRGGYVEQHKVNLADHWLTSAKGRYWSLPVIALAGEHIVLDHDIAVREGSVGVYVERFFGSGDLWAHRVRNSAHGRFTVEVPETGLYNLVLSYFSFAGQVTIDWKVE